MLDTWVIAFIRKFQVKIEVELNEAAIRAITYFKDPNDGRDLTAQEIIQELANDLGLTNTRSGSWEGSNMQQVIDGHGWENHL